VGTKVAGIVLSCIFLIGILLGVVVPSVAFVLGLGISIPNRWMRYQKILILYSHPWFSLVGGMLLVSVLAWGIWRLAKA
jgi:hypothetical protein